jgi:hypothetical protein
VLAKAERALGHYSTTRRPTLGEFSSVLGDGALVGGTDTLKGCVLSFRPQITLVPGNLGLFRDSPALGRADLQKIHDHGLSSVHRLSLFPCDETNRRPKIRLEDERGAGVLVSLPDTPSTVGRPWEHPSATREEVGIAGPDAERTNLVDRRIRRIPAYVARDGTWQPLASEASIGVARLP